MTCGGDHFLGSRKGAEPQRAYINCYLFFFSKYFKIKYNNFLSHFPLPLRRFPCVPPIHSLLFYNCGFTHTHTFTHIYIHEYILQNISIELSQHVYLHMISRVTSWGWIVNQKQDAEDQRLCGVWSQSAHL